MPTGRKRVRGKLGVIVRNVVPMRAKPDGDSEQVTQGLIGQPIVTEGGQGDWLFVQCWDNYRAWVQSEKVRFLESKAAPYASVGPVAVMRELFVDILAEPRENAEIITKATIATEIEVARLHDGWVELKLPNGRPGFIRKHEAKLVDKDIAQTIWLPEPRKLTETAMRFIGVPYLWGGTSPFGIDCSGFVQLIYKVHNVTFLRDAHMQAGDARSIEVAKPDLRAGDLVFFSSLLGSSSLGRDLKSRPNPNRPNPNLKNITHVGMMIDREHFIHSSGALGVAITDIHDPYYSDIYWGARRMRLDTLDPGGGVAED
ncbi:MAG: C40 family peptidase [Armatimonadetes bacterium]|nr:C40 family peptidase [Armatimonadota bacterium]